MRKHLTDGEFKALKAWCQANKTVDSVIVELLLVTGMRQGELIQVTAKDLDPTYQAVRVTPLKGSRPRMAPLSPELYARTARVLEVFPTLGHAVCMGSVASQKRMVRFTWERVLKSALGAQVVSTHGARHTYAVRILEATGRDILKTRIAMGHESVNSTMKYLDTLTSIDLIDDIKKAVG